MDQPTEHYVTLFDGNFLPQGLALHESLREHAGPFVLWVLCMDERARRVLKRLDKPEIRAVSLKEVETPELLAVKPGRSRAEYCWTITPFTPRIVFDRDSSARRATYVDADMFVMKSPAPIFAELDNTGKAVQITDHAYSPEYDHSARSGRYCVQFMTFERDAGEEVRRWWQARCLEWCFAREEDGKFGDQMYLDDWPERFADSVHVLSQLDSLMAPWNARRFPHGNAIAWHFHSLRLRPGRRVRLYSEGYDIPSSVIEDIYRPYLASLDRQLEQIGEPVIQESPSALAELKTWFWALRHRHVVRRRNIASL